MANIVRDITDREVDFAQWYTDVCKKADLVDYSKNKGSMIIRPYGYAIWENMVSILDKEFKIDTRGYRPQEVDKFLDVIIGDYTKFIALVKRLDSEKKALIEDNLRLKKELREAQDKIELLKNTSSKEITNVDMLRRISMLEKAVFRDNDNNY